METHEREIDALRLVRLNRNEYYSGFWLFKNNQNIVQFNGIYQAGMLEFLTKYGFKKIYHGDKLLIVLEDNNVLIPTNADRIRDVVREIVYKKTGEIKYLHGEQHITVSSDNLRNKFLAQSHLIFNNLFLNNLPSVDTKPLKDTIGTMHLPFVNGVLIINKDGYELKPYSDIKQYHIFKKQIIKHQFSKSIDGHISQFEKFIQNVGNKNKERIAALESAFGYLIHNYNDPAKTKAVICYDEEITDGKAYMGGTGKGIYTVALKQVRNVSQIDGKKFDSRDKFAFQEVTIATQILSIEDVNAGFDFDRFNSLITDGFNVEEKGKQSYTIDAEQAPKIIITSNIILSNEGTTKKRRQMILEFSTHYSSKIKTGKEEPIIEEHGARFFTEWDANEWNRFYNYIVRTATNYLKEGLQYAPVLNSSINRLIQQTSKEFHSWITEQNLVTNEWYDSKEYYAKYKELYLQDDDEFTQRGFSKWIKSYAALNNLRAIYKSTNNKNLFKLEEI